MPALYSTVTQQQTHQMRPVFCWDLHVLLPALYNRHHTKFIKVPSFCWGSVRLSETGMNISGACLLVAAATLLKQGTRAKLTVEVVVQWVEVSAGVFLVVPVKVEPELLTRFHHLLLLTITTLDA